MSESLMKHFVALSGTLVCLLVYWVGYVGGKSGIWLPVLGLIAIYVIIYKLLDM